MRPSEQRVQKKKCEQDLLHWLRFFCFVYEPRDLKEPDKPFFPYDFQVEEFKFLQETLERCSGAQTPKENVLYEKSRDMTVSWIVYMTFLFFFQFHQANFLIGSRKEEEVDKAGDMDTPMQKIKYQLRKQHDLTPWLLPEGWNPKKQCNHLLIVAPDGIGGQIAGESANTEFGRGGRNLAVAFDEFSKWQYASESWRACQGTTKVRIPISTPGETGMEKFARLRFQLDGAVTVRTMHWSLHPDKARDLEIVNGRPTSSWYREEIRTSSAEDLAKEVDISYAPSVRGRVFDKYGFGHQVRGLKPVSNKQIVIGIDPGLEFHVTWGQVDSYETLMFLKEIHRKGAHIEEMAQEILDINARYFNEFEFYYVGDPAGSYRTNSGQLSSEFAVLLTDYGIQVNSNFLGKIPPKDRVKARVQILDKKMGEFSGQTGRAGLLVDPDECPFLDRAFAGEYRRMTDINGVTIDQIKEEHPSEDAVDSAGFIALAKIPWGMFGFSKDRIKVRQNQVYYRRPSGQFAGGGYTRG